MNFDLLSEVDKKIIEISGYGAKRGYGTKPAVIVIDAQNKFVGPDVPILDAISVYPLSIGERANRATEQIKGVLDIARNKQFPIFYSVSSVPSQEIRFNSFAKKRTPHEITGNIPEDREEIVSILKPCKNEYIIHKRYASAFFGTELMTFLNTVNCDTLIITGFITSGCVRACAVDAASYNFNVIIPEECVADRFEVCHDMSLIDLNMKYADVVPVYEVLEYLESVVVS